MDFSQYDISLTYEDHMCHSLTKISRYSISEGVARMTK